MKLQYRSTEGARTLAVEQYIYRPPSGSKIGAKGRKMGIGTCKELCAGHAKLDYASRTATGLGESQYGFMVRYICSGLVDELSMNLTWNFDPYASM